MLNFSDCFIDCGIQFLSDIFLHKPLHLECFFVILDIIFATKWMHNNMIDLFFIKNVYFDKAFLKI